MLPDDCFLHETLSSNLFKLNCLINHYYYCKSSASVSCIEHSPFLDTKNYFTYFNISWDCCYHSGGSILKNEKTYIKVQGTHFKLKTTNLLDWYVSIILKGLEKK